MSSSTIAATSSTWSNLTSFVAAHRAAILLGSAAVVGSAAGAYYIYNSSAPGSKPKPSSKKSKKSKKTKKSVEIQSQDLTSNTFAGFDLISIDNSPKFPDIPEDYRISDIPEEDRKAISQQLKVVGNHFYSEKDYNKALQFYNKAIATYNDAIFHANRAACYWAMEDYESVIDESTKALELNPSYTKSYMRRAHAYENLKKNEDAILDYSSALVLSNFSDQTTNSSVNRMLTETAEQSAKSYLEEHPKHFPSPSFCTAFYRTLTNVLIIPEALENAEPESADYDVRLALEAVRKGSLESYEQAYELLNKALEKESDGDNSYIAFAHRSVLNHLRSDLEAAKEDATKSIALKGNVLAYLIRSSVALESSELSDIKVQLSQAEVCDPRSPYVKFHNAQLYFLMGQYKEALIAYEEAITIDPEFLLARIQKLVTNYHLGAIEKAHEGFKELQELFPHSFEVFNYEGEIYLDSKKVSEANELFDKAVSVVMEQNKNGSVNVTPLVNKALAFFNEARADEAIDILRKAIALDPLSDLAYTTLIQIYLQMQRSEEAFKYFPKSFASIRTLPELIQQYTLYFATKTQIRMAKERPFLQKKLEEFQAKNMAMAYAQSMSASA
ncbi:uncharacterized protein SAPINGB_P004043 [Magnusiomyces paraingens]|uniref:Mitochondrial import receptor subunit TOM70 n=1 Tax=Magnusiomyces paraingens TaxID=2606893 RepID=A0A5E8BSH4_9ASCO|nr:uncharacterized protein SAPINGB_P004043 [Saprochaete ingens]VVT54373.1 unnamed protein product [Saprochaete ingens]